MIQHLFSYGTLQNEKVQIKLFGRLLFGSKEKLPGYRLDSLRITDKAVLATSSQHYHPIAMSSQIATDFIEGMMFGITAEELKTADLYEVEDYKRIEVTMQSGKKAWIYVAIHTK